MQSADDIELQEGRHDRWRRRNDTVELADAEDPGKNGDRENADQDGAPDLQRIESGDDEEAEDCEERTGLLQIPEADECRLVGDDDARALKRDDRQEETDTSCDRASERMRYTGDQPTADAGHRQEDEDATRNEDRAKRLLPGKAEG